MNREITASLGIIVIGRNEGERLSCCLRSVVNLAKCVVYVDSGSTDQSVQIATEMGIVVVELDPNRPYTAARARNAGFKRLREITPSLEFVQFIDGDCEMASDWLPQAVSLLKQSSDIAITYGRLRERYPNRSIYNMLCDLEWDTAIGESSTCGGIILIRWTAFEAAAGFREDMIAGEEPELCIRLRSLEWRIWRIDTQMALHDASILHFSQWWMRTLRAGYAYAHVSNLHGTQSGHNGVSESRSAWFWGLMLPVTIFVIAFNWYKWAIAFILLYPLQVIRIALRGKHSFRKDLLHALFLVLGKFPEMLGQSKFILHRLRGIKTIIIEYK